MLFPAAVVDLFGMDTHGLPDPAAILHGAGYNPFIHGITSFIKLARWPTHSMRCPVGSPPQGADPPDATFDRPFYCPGRAGVPGGEIFWGCDKIPSCLFLPPVVY